MKNNYEIRGNITVIFLNSKKHGTQEALIDTSDFELVSKINTQWHVRKWGAERTFYVVGNIKEDNKRSTIRLHRVITNADKGYVVDHINHNGLDNRKENLRVTTQKNNSQNREGANFGSKTGVRNVCVDNRSGKYIAKIHIDGKFITSKLLDTIEEATLEAENLRKKYMPYSMK